VDDARFEGVRPEPTAPPAVDGAEVTGNPFIAFLRRFFGMD
jgi:hypothetical protein